MTTFEFKAVSFSFSHSDGVVSVSRNLEGTVEGFGKVLATVTFHGIQSTSGSLEYVGANYPAGGPRSVAVGHGEWSRLSATRVATTGTTRIITGEDTTSVKFDGEYDMAALTWTGTFE